MSTANFSKKHNLPVLYLIRVFMSSLREENPHGDTSGRFSRCIIPFFMSPGQTPAFLHGYSRFEKNLYYFSEKAFHSGYDYAIIATLIHSEFENVRI